MGSAYRETCHDTDALASANVCGAEYPRIDYAPDGSSIYRTCSVGAGSEVVVVSAPASGASSSMSYAPAYSACDPAEHYEQVGLLFAMAIPAVLAVYLIKATFRPLGANQ